MPTNSIHSWRNCRQRLGSQSLPVFHRPRELLKARRSSRFLFLLTTTVKHLNQTADTWQDELQFKVSRPGPSGRMEERWSASTLTRIKSVTSCLPIGCHRGSFQFDFACSAWHQLINVAGTWFLWPPRLLTEHFWAPTLPEASRPRLL